MNREFGKGLTHTLLSPQIWEEEGENNMYRQALLTMKELEGPTALEDILARIRQVSGIPDKHDELLKECLEDDFKFAKLWRRRDLFNQAFSWAVPSMEALQHIAAFARGTLVIEIGCGMGLWAALLKKLGLDIVATDLQAPRETFCKVEKKDFRTALTQHRRRKTLLMVWPPQQGQQGSEMAHETLLRFRGPRIVYVGEQKGGCTATEDFFKQINWTKQLGPHTTARWEVINQIMIPRWPGVQDSCYLLQRNPPCDLHGQDERLVNFPVCRSL